MENISQMSLLEIAVKLMEQKGTVENIYKLIEEVLELKGLTDETGALATKLYVDITTSSKFVYMGDGLWDLKSRQPLEQFEKDGSAFYSKADEDEEEIIEDYEDEDIDDEDLEDEDEDLEDEDEDTDDEDTDDEDLDEDSEDFDDDLEYEDSEDDLDDSDDSFDEDKYTEYMDDYEDMYDED